MEQLKQEAQQIRDETLANQNTATRVGGWMVRLIDRLTEVFQTKLGSKHDVEVETVDYGSKPVSSMTFNGERFKLKLQIPRGKDGKDGETPSIDKDGNWEMGSVSGGTMVVEGNTGYEITVTPENPAIDNKGTVQGVTKLTVNCYQKTLIGTRRLVTRSDMRLVARYRLRQASGLEEAVGEDVEKSPLSGNMEIPAQQSTGTKKSNALELTVRPLDSDDILASKEVQYNIIGGQGEPGRNGGVYVPDVNSNGFLSYEVVSMEGSSTPFFQPRQIVPKVNPETGNWLIMEEDTGILGDASGAVKTANAALETARSASSTANSAASAASSAQTTANQAKTAADNASSAAQTAAANASSALTKANSAASAASSAQTTANQAKTAADNAKILATGPVKTLNAGMCQVLDDSGLEYIIVNMTAPSSEMSDFCVTSAISTQDKVCYFLFKNVGTIQLILTFGGTKVYAPASSAVVDPGCAREVSYFLSSVTKETYISFGPQISLIQ